MSRRILLALGATVAASVAVPAVTEAASDLELEAVALIDCPNGAVVQIVAGTSPRCDLDGDNRLDVRYPGSDGIERRQFLRMCRDVGCNRLVWFIPAGDVDRGQWMFIGVDH